jgi:hypothetical protein
VYQIEAEPGSLFFRLKSGMFARISREEFERAVRVVEVLDCPKCRRRF